MSRRYYYRKRRDNPLEALVPLGVLGAVAIGTQYNKLTDLNTTALVIVAVGGAILVAALLAMLTLAIQRHRQQQLKQISLAQVDTMDGLAFEQYVAGLLRFQGYQHVQLTEKYDYGVDIIADKDGVRWGIQVKRYSGLVKAAAVRQVVTALTKYNCQRSMVVSNSVYSHPAQVLAQSNHCILIDRTTLAEWIIAFQSRQA